jgi:hypothetical protein
MNTAPRKKLIDKSIGMPHLLDQIRSPLIFSTHPCLSPYPPSSEGSALSEGEREREKERKKNYISSGGRGKMGIGKPSAGPWWGERGPIQEFAAVSSSFSEYCVEKGMVRRLESEK